MSLRWLSILFAAGLAFGCGASTTKVEPGEPQTAKEKQLQEARASGEIDGPSAKWGKWRYKGDRKNCFFVVGKRCFKNENGACQAARCRAPKKCKSTGAGPATVSCK